MLAQDESGDFSIWIMDLIWFHNLCDDDMNWYDIISISFNLPCLCRMSCLFTNAKKDWSKEGGVISYNTGKPSMVGDIRWLFVYCTFMVAVIWLCMFMYFQYILSRVRNCRNSETLNIPTALCKGRRSNYKKLSQINQSNINHSLDNSNNKNTINISPVDIHYPSRELTYPTLGKGKSSSKCHFWGIC